MPSGLAKELVLVSSSQGSGDSGSGGMINSAQLSGSTGSQNNNSKGVTILAEKLSKRLPKADQGGSLQFLDTSLNNLFDSIRLKNGPLVHQQTFDLTRLLEEEFAKTNLNGSDSIGAMLMGSD